VKKAFLLLEVLASITLIGIILIALIEIKNNNIFLLDRTVESAKIDRFISLGAMLGDTNSSKKDEKIYLKDHIDFKDDELRSYIKDIVVEKRTIEQEPLIFDESDFTLSVNINQVNYSLKSGENKNFYKFSLEY
jgi:hypothetical protein